jgi:beta-lactam-binding protein with PASTA domain
MKIMKKLILFLSAYILIIIYLSGCSGNPILVTVSPENFYGMIGPPCFDKRIIVRVESTDPNVQIESVMMSMRLHTVASNGIGPIFSWSDFLTNAYLDIYDYGGVIKANYQGVELNMIMKNIDGSGWFSYSPVLMTPNKDFPGVFENQIDLSELSFCGDDDLSKTVAGSNIDEFEIMLVGIDSKGREGSYKKLIKVIGETKPEIILEKPGPTISDIVSPRPTFTWRYGTTILTGGYQRVELAYAPGDDLWNWNNLQRKSILIESGSGLGESKWELPEEKRLSPGKYAWGIELKINKNTYHSSVYHFTVPKYWADLTVKNRVVSRSDVVPENRKLPLQWVVKLGDDILLKRDASNEFSFDFRRFTTDDSFVGYEIWLEAQYNQQYQRISNVVTISEVAVPDVVGKTATDAQSILKNLGFTINVINGKSKLEIGKIYKQDPGRGTWVIPRETTIKIYNTTETENLSIAVTDVVGKTYDEAKKILEDLGFSTQVVDGASSMEIGKIYNQDPPAGTFVLPSKTIIILYKTIKQLSDPLPDLYGKLVEDAQKILENLGFSTEVVESENEMESGHVYAQFPPSGEQVAIRSKVVLYVSKGRPENTSSPEPTSPTLYADKNYLCLYGPGREYVHVADIPKGTSYEIIGQASNGWIKIAIDIPATGQKSCWIGGGIVSGDLSDIPIMTPETTSAGGTYYAAVYAYCNINWGYDFGKITCRNKPECGYYSSDENNNLFTTTSQLKDAFTSTHTRYWRLLNYFTFQGDANSQPSGQPDCPYYWYHNAYYIDNSIDP